MDELFLEMIPKGTFPILLCAPILVCEINISLGVAIENLLCTNSLLPNMDNGIVFNVPQ